MIYKKYTSRLYERQLKSELNPQIVPYIRDNLDFYLNTACKSTQGNVLRVAINCADSDGSFSISHIWWAKEAGCSVFTLKKYINQLEHDGVLSVYSPYYRKCVYKVAPEFLHVSVVNHVRSRYAKLRTMTLRELLDSRQDYVLDDQSALFEKNNSCQREYLLLNSLGSFIFKTSGHPDVHEMSYKEDDSYTARARERKVSGSEAQRTIMLSTLIFDTVRFTPEQKKILSELPIAHQQHAAQQLAKYRKANKSLRDEATWVLHVATNGPLTNQIPFNPSTRSKTTTNGKATQSKQIQLNRVLDAQKKKAYEQHEMGYVYDKYLKSLQILRAALRSYEQDPTEENQLWLTQREAEHEHWKGIYESLVHQFGPYKKPEPTPVHTAPSDLQSYAQYLGATMPSEVKEQILRLKAQKSDNAMLRNNPVLDLILQDYLKTRTNSTTITSKQDEHEREEVHNTRTANTLAARGR